MEVVAYNIKSLEIIPFFEIPVFSRSCLQHSFFSGKNSGFFKLWLPEAVSFRFILRKTLASSNSSFLRQSPLDLFCEKLWLLQTLASKNVFLKLQLRKTPASPNSSFEKLQLLQTPASKNSRFLIERWLENLVT